MSIRATPFSTVIRSMTRRRSDWPACGRDSHPHLVTEPLHARQCLLSVLLLPLALVNLPLGPIKLLTVRRQLIHVLFVPVQVHGLTDVCFGHPVFLSCARFSAIPSFFRSAATGWAPAFSGTVILRPQPRFRRFLKIRWLMRSAN